MGNSRWNPWAALRAHPEIRLEWDRLGGARGLAIVDFTGPLVVLDYRLPRRERRAVLAHELIHHERGIPTAGAPPHIVEREEASVDQEVARRLVPLDELAAFVAARATVGGVTSYDVADEFEVPNRVAVRAMRLLRHPSSAAVRKAAGLDGSMSPASSSAAAWSVAGHRRAYTSWVTRPPPP